jgi:hypothetical protein
MHVRSFELYGPECPLVSAISDPSDAPRDTLNH